MRRKIKKYKEHETRLITIYLFFPRTIGCEQRWLEAVTIKQRWTDDYPDGFYWNDIKWID